MKINKKIKQLIGLIILILVFSGMFTFIAIGKGFFLAVISTVIIGALTITGILLITLTLDDKSINVKKFSKWEDKHMEYLFWCLDNKGEMSVKEWDTIKSIEFKRRGLDTYFN